MKKNFEENFKVWCQFHVHADANAGKGNQEFRGSKSAIFISASLLSGFSSCREKLLHQEQILSFKSIVQISFYKGFVI